MRERAALYGGTLEAGPGPDGGFRVTAVLPVGERLRRDDPGAGRRRPGDGPRGPADDPRRRRTTSRSWPRPATDRRPCDAVAEHRPDVVLMDIRMPGMDGLQATERLLRGGRPGPRVLVLTTFGEDEYLYAAMRAGASGFLLKDSPPGGAAARRPHGRRRLRAARPRADPAADRGVGAPSPAGRRRARAAAAAHAARARGVHRARARPSNGEIAADLVLSETTVKSHVAHCWPSSTCGTACRPSSSATSAGSSVPAAEPGRYSSMRQVPTGE